MRVIGWLWALVALLPAAALADSEIDAQVKRVEAALSRLQAEQQSVYQQFQMVQELRRQAMQQARQPEQVSRPSTSPQNYDDMVREQQAQQDREQRYQYEADRLYDRYRELEEQKKPLLERLNELAQER
jgi:chromosome segregation ATPase